MRIPFATRLAPAARRAVQARGRVVLRASAGSAAARPRCPRARRARATTAMSARQRQATKAAPTTTTSSAAKLDCENEISSPSQVTTSAAAATSDEPQRAGRSTSRTSDGSHRDHEEPPVHRRVPEDGVDAEERRVRVRVDHLRVLEDVARLVLVEADDREPSAITVTSRVERAQAERAPRQPRDRDREQRERHVEREQLDRALAARPCSRGAKRRSTRGRRRAARRARRSSRDASSPASEIPGEQDRRAEDDDVERHEQLRARAADVHADARPARRRARASGSSHGTTAEERPRARAPSASAANAPPSELERPVCGATATPSTHAPNAAKPSPASRSRGVVATSSSARPRHAIGPPSCASPITGRTPRARSTWPCSLTVSV